ncbi:MAG: 2-C-methyl-D-erythritol 4-phosphate cytidylyltransferase [Armatimonadota bacterium]
MTDDISAIIVAAGAGARFGAEIPKVYVHLSGRPVLAWSLQAYASVRRISRIIVVAAPAYLDRAADICRAEIPDRSWEVVAGGQRRQDSVRLALHHLQSDPPDIVCIHDGARPLVSSDIITASIETCAEHGTAVACIPVTDTIKRFNPDGTVDDTLERSRLRAIQTPQTFDFRLILRAHEQAAEEGRNVTDDAAVVEAAGHPVVASEGSPENIKITRPQDLPHAQWLMERRYGMTHEAALRAGHGYDIHRLAPGRPLILCGVHVEHEFGLAGHSDADAPLHAVTDAILGAAGLGDIGQHFPDTDPAYKGADSAALLVEAVKKAAETDLRVGNVDLTIIAQAPKLAAYRDRMRAKLAKLCGISEDCANIKAKTAEGMGPVGRKEAIAAHAVVTLLSQGDEVDPREDYDE